MRIPYGFILDNSGTLEINKREADNVALIFDFYMAGASLGKVVDMLYAKQIPSPTGKTRWTRAAVDHLLSNGKYVAIIGLKKFLDVQFEKAARCNIDYDKEGLPRKNTRYAGKVKWGFWHEAFVASGGPIFSLAREKIGEKRVRGDAGCFLRLNSDKNQYVRLAFHSGVTSRMSDYAQPDTVGIKFVISCCRISAINRRCSLNLSGCTFLHWIL